MQWLDEMGVGRGTAAVAEFDGTDELVVIDPNDADGFRAPADKPCEPSPAEPRSWEPLCARDPDEDDSEEEDDLDYLYEDEDDDLDDDLDEDLDDDLEDDLDDDLEEEDDDL